MVPLTVALMVGTSTIPGCNKIEEFAGKAGDDGSAENAEGESNAEAADAAKDEEAKKDEDEDKVVEAPEPIPVEPLHNGLDLMLSFVPDDKAQYVIIRDASVIAEYLEEATRFVEPPLGRLVADPLGSPSDVQEMKNEWDRFKAESQKLVDALNASGLDLKEGGALIRLSSNKTVMVFAAEQPDAMVKVAEALGEKGSAKPENCKALEGHEGWNVCAEDKATLDGYKPAEDPAPVRQALETTLPGVDLEAANLLVNIDDGGKVAAAVTTLPGLVHAVITGNFAEKDKVAKQAFDALQPGEAKAMSNVQPGAGFVWARIDPKVMAEAFSKAGTGDPSADAFVKSLSGEWLLSGTVNPGGFIVQASMSDVSTFGPLLTMAESASGLVPQQPIPEIPDAKLVVEKTSVSHEDRTVDALHVGLTGLPEADVLRSFAGLNVDAWAFAAGDVLTLAVGPNAENIGKLISSGDGPSEETLASLPPQLAASLQKNEVSAVIHMPLDFLHGAHLNKLLDNALKNVPVVKPSQLRDVFALAAPLSSATAWVTKTEAGTPMVHMALQGIGNRSTEEGKEALAAALAVSEGADPEATFKPLAEKYKSSALAFAYATRAGTDGPGPMVGSGLGAVAAVAALGGPVFLGSRNATLADDLGVKPEDPEPVVAITTPPKPQVFEPTEPPKPKKPKPKPKPTPTVDEPKKDDPIVEPDKPVEPELPKPPVPTPTVDPKPTEPKKKPAVTRLPPGPPTRGPQRPTPK